jgi:hypothetical protein
VKLGKQELLSLNHVLRGQRPERFGAGTMRYQLNPHVTLTLLPSTVDAAEQAGRARPSPPVDSVGGKLRRVLSAIGGKVS